MIVTNERKKSKEFIKKKIYVQKHNNSIDSEMKLLVAKL